MPETGKPVTPETFTFALRRDRLRQARRREGRYLLRSNMTGEDPATLWKCYMRLTEIEQAFKELKHDLAIRPIFHQREEPINEVVWYSPREGPQLLLSGQGEIGSALTTRTARRLTRRRAS